MNLSNYPPGVTGNEYAISGAEKEWEEERECPHCGVTQTLFHEAHHEFGVVAFCPDPNCEGRFGITVEPEEPEYYAYDYMDEE
jgi:hypothetical protein